MDINTIKTLINAYIHKNGVQAITGDILNGVLLKMVDFDQESVADLRSSVRDALEELDRRKPDRSDIDEVMRHIFDEVERIYETKADASATKSELLAIIATLATKAQLQATAAGLNDNILAESERATSAEQDLSARIDTIVQGRNVRDIVANYDELLAYDTSTLGDNDIIMVLLDATKSGHTTYYRWNLVMQEWEFIGGLAFTYTKTEIDQKFAALHIVLPTFDAESSQEVLAQVDTMVRGAGADASFKVAIPVDDLSGNLDVTYVKSNPANLYLGVFADDRSVLYHITRTISQPRTYTCEVITKNFVEVSDFVREVTRIEAQIATKQPTLVSGENIKTINGESVLGGGNISTKSEDLDRICRDFGRYANPTEHTLQNATSGKYVDAVTGLAVNNSAYSISQPVNLLAGDILLVPSASAVLAACSVVSRIVTNTYDKAILYTYTYDERGRIASAKADYNSAIYTAHYPDEETNTPDYWIYGAEHLTNLPTTHSVTESFYEPLVKQSVAVMPDEGYYVYLASRNMDVVISAFNATINGGKIIKVGWGIFKNIATNFVGHPQQRVIADYLCNLEARISGFEDKLLNGFDRINVGHLHIRRECSGINVNGSFTLQGDGVPSADRIPINWDTKTYGDWKGLPQFIGQTYIDTSNKIAYIACGVDAVSDWKRITN